MELIEGPSLDRVLRQLKGSNQPPTPLAETTSKTAGEADGIHNYA